MAKRTESVQRTDRASQVVWPALTVEAVLYAALIAGAAFIRLFDLGRWPLLADEAEQALAAWRFLHTQPMIAQNPVPLLFDGALLGFFAFGANDTVARLLPALLGALLVPLPLLFRRHLGTWGSLAATFVLGFSPTLVFYSRTLTGPIPALAGLGAVLLALELAHRGQDRWAKVSGVGGLAVALTSSPWTYTFLLAVLLFIGLGWAANRKGRSWPGWEAGRRRLEPLFRDVRAWGLLGLTVFLLSTALLMRPSGLQGTADLFATWLGRLTPGSAGHAWGYPLGILIYYELGVLLLGVAGLVVGLQQRSLWAGFLGVWTLLALLSSTMSGAHDAAPVAFAVFPLSLLSGLAVNAISARLRTAQWAWVASSLFVLSTILGFWWLQLATYATFGPQGARPFSPALLGLLILITPLFLVAVLFVFWSWVGRAETVWAITILGLGMLSCLLLRNTVGLNLAYARDPHEPLVVNPSSIDLKDLVAFTESWSARKVGDQHALAIATEEGLAPLIPWYLREFNLRLLPSPTEEAGADAVVLSTQPGRAALTGYVGQRYRLWTSLEAPRLMERQALSWWLLRSGGDMTEARTIELWVKP